MKTVGGFRKSRFVGIAKTQLAAYMVGAAYNLLRMARLQPNTGSADASKGDPGVERRPREYASRSGGRGRREVGYALPFRKALPATSELTSPMTARRSFSGRERTL